MNNHDETATAQGAFRISSQPVTKEFDGASAQKNAAAADQLPRSYGTPLLFAVARDPKSIFVYWDIDWTKAFAGGAPSDRKAYLRICDNDGAELQRVSVEPMAGTADLPTASLENFCLIEIGYVDLENNWRGLATSNPVTIPADKVGVLAPGDFALVPFHITFQRLTDLFRATKNPDEPLTQALVRLEKTAADPGKRPALSAAEHEIYRAMKASAFVQRESRPASGNSAEERQLQKKLERVLGFGGTSPHRSLGGSS